MYDIIGDVHGNYKELKRLLTILGYTKKDRVYSHPDRKAIFVGDFVNRGPSTKKTISLIRKMHKNEQALCIPGNHEYNLLKYFFLYKNALFENLEKAHKSVATTLEEYKTSLDKLESHISWIQSLPLFIDNGKLRIAHACWDKESVQFFKTNYTLPSLTNQIIERSLNENNPESKYLRTILSGKEVGLPPDLKILNNRGVQVKSFRIKWWIKPEGKTFRELSFGNKFLLPAYTVPKELSPKQKPYSRNDIPVFMGHYCLSKDEEMIPQKNICCLDRCISSNGKLFAYRWNGEKQINLYNLISVEKQIY